LYDP